MSVILLHIRITQTLREKRKESVSLKPYYMLTRETTEQLPRLKCHICQLSGSP
jgi:hypothetical protein